MTTAPAAAPTTVSYEVTIPIYACVTVYVDAADGLTNEEVIARVTDDDIFYANCVYPEKLKEVTREAIDTITRRPNEVIVEKS